MIFLKENNKHHQHPIQTSIISRQAWQKMFLARNKGEKRRSVICRFIEKRWSRQRHGLKGPTRSRTEAEQPFVCFTRWERKTCHLVETFRENEAKWMEITENTMTITSLSPQRTTIISSYLVARCGAVGHCAKRAAIQYCIHYEFNHHRKLIKQMSFYKWFMVNRKNKRKINLKSWFLVKLVYGISSGGKWQRRKANRAQRTNAIISQFSLFQYPLLDT